MKPADANHLFRGQEQCLDLVLRIDAAALWGVQSEQRQEAVAGLDLYAGGLIHKLLCCHGLETEKGNAKQVLCVRGNLGIVVATYRSPASGVQRNIGGAAARNQIDVVRCLPMAGRRGDGKSAIADVADECQ